MLKKSKRLIVLGIIFISSVSFQNQEKAIAKDNFPVPKGIKHLLFYVQRTLNINTIIYELNLEENGEVNATEPIKFYYINYANKSEIEPVSYLQKKYAYGFEIKLTDAEKKTWSFHLNSFKNKELYLIKSSDNAYHVFCKVNGKLAILSRVFVQMETGAIGFPKVKYVVIHASEPGKMDELTETLIP